MIRSSEVSKVEKIQEKLMDFRVLKVELQAIASRVAPGTKGFDQSELSLPAVSKVQNAVLEIQRRFTFFSSGFAVWC